MSGRISALAGYRDASGKVDAVRGRGERRRVEVDRRRHDLQAGVRRAASAVDRRDRRRPVQPQERLGRHRRVLDPQQRLDRRRHLQVDRRRRDLDARGPARFGAHFARSSSTRATPTPSTPACRASSGATRADRGLYKTTDGGKSWQLVLKGANLSTGCGSIAMEPGNPDVLFAGLWDFRRKGWTFRSGGDGPKAPSGSGLYPQRRRRRDLDRAHARQGTRGCRPSPTAASRWPSRRAIRRPSTPSSSRPTRRSSSRTTAAPPGSGATRASGWSGGRSISPTSIVDPKNAERVFKTDLQPDPERGRRQELQRDRRLRRQHGDCARRVRSTRPTRSTSSRGDDGGLWISYDGGNKWWKADNLPISQFYHVSLDDKDPVPGLRRPAGQQLLGRRFAPIRAASPARAGRTSTAATASGCSPTRPIPTSSMPSTRAATSGASTCSTPRGARHPAQARRRGSQALQEAALQLEHADRAVAA